MWPFKRKELKEKNSENKKSLFAHIFSKKPKQDIHTSTSIKIPDDSKIYPFNIMQKKEINEIENPREIAMLRYNELKRRHDDGINRIIVNKSFNG